MHFHRITVITRVGKKYHTRRLYIHTDGLKMEGSKKQWIALPRNEVTRIEMRPWWRHVEDLAWPAMAPLVPPAMICGGIGWEPTRLDPLCMALAVPVFLPGYAYLAVIAPFYVGADLVGFLRPPTVFDILDGTPVLGNSERESRGE